MKVRNNNCIGYSVSTNLSGLIVLYSNFAGNDTNRSDFNCSTLQ